MGRGTVSETYHAALAHGLADLGEATRIGVVRRPTAWFHGEIDENVPELGPPEELLSEFQERREGLKTRGMCDEGAHNAAWEEVGFGERYDEHLGSPEAREVLSGLAERVAGGEDIVLVCYEADSKRCHRRPLVDAIEERTGGA
ncbi:DUF488 domain-containing protein [Halalkalicoccus tibetensis]|uniref:DUF488 domain-containing protein n=1 Tax=Halalkalicoccus tibetensis TaxID=175632 RepID=A0ABD5UZ12_9EURY